MTSRLVRTFTPEEVQVGDLICHGQANDADSVIFECNRRYRVKVQLARVGSEHWFDVIVNIADLNREEAREAIAVAVKLALTIEDTIKEILFKHEKNWLRLFDVSFSLTGLIPSLNAKVQREEERNQGQAQKSAPYTLSMRLGRFVNLVISSRRKEWPIEL